MICSKTSRTAHSARFLLLAACCAALRPVSATDWQGSVDSNWQTPGNWSFGQVPTQFDFVNFNNFSFNNSIQLDGDGYASSLNFGAMYSLSGGTLHLSQAASITANNFQNVTIGSSIVSDGSMSLNGNINLTGANSWVGQTSINSGFVNFNQGSMPDNQALSINSAGAMFSGPLNVTQLNGSDGSISVGGTLTVGAGDQSSFFSGTIFAGTLRKVGSGYFSDNLSSFSPSILNDVSVEGGTLSIANFNSFGSSMMPSLNSASISAGATFAPSGVQIFSLNGEGNLQISNTVRVGGGSFAGVVTGFGSLEVDGSLAFTGNGSTDFPAYMTLLLQDNANLSIQHDFAAPAGATLNMFQQSTVNLNGHRQQFAGALGDGTINLGGGTLTLGGLVMPPMFGADQNVNVSGDGELSLLNSGSFGQIAVSQLRVAGDATIGFLNTSRVIFDGGTLTSSSLINPMSIEGTGVINANSINVVTTRNDQFIGEINLQGGSFSLSGGGALTLIGQFFNTHEVDISNSTLRLGSLAFTNSTSVRNSGTLDLAGNSVFVNALDSEGVLLLGTAAQPAMIGAQGSSFIGQNVLAGMIGGVGSVSYQATFGGTVLSIHDLNSISGNDFRGAIFCAETTTMDGVHLPQASVTAGASLSINTGGAEVSQLSMGFGTLSLNGTLAIAPTNGDGESSIGASLSGNGTIIQRGGGRISLNGQLNGFEGNFQIESGTFDCNATSVGNANTFAISVLDGADFRFSDSPANLPPVRDISGGGRITVTNGSTLTIVSLDGDNHDFAGVIDGEGSVEFNGRFLLHKPQEFTGGLIIRQPMQLHDQASFANATPIDLESTLDCGSVSQSFGSVGGNGTLIVGGDLRIGGNDLDSELYGRMTVGGSFTKVGAGTLRLRGGTVDYQGAFSHGIQVQEGTLSLEFVNNVADSILVQSLNANVAILQADQDAAMGHDTIPLTLANGTLRALDSFTTSRPIHLGLNANGSGTINVADSATLSIQSSIDGVTGLIKSGPGILQLMASNSYSGSTIVREGTLMLSGSGAISEASTLRIEASGALDLGGADRRVGSLAGAGTVALDNASLTFGSNGAVTTFTGTVAGNGGIIKSGPSQVTFSGNNSFTGGVQVNGGTLVLLSSNTFTGNARINGGVLSVSADADLGASANNISFNGGTLQCAGNFSSSRSMSVTSSGAINIPAGNLLTENGTIGGSGVFHKSGTGVLRLTNANGFTGTLQIDPAGGTVSLAGSNGAIAASIVNIALGGSLELNNSTITGGNQSSGDRISDSAAFNFNGGMLSMIGADNTSSSELVGPLNLLSSATTISLLAGSGGSTSLSFASLQRTIGASMNISGLGIGDTNRLLLRTTPGAIGAWLKINGLPAKYDAAAGLVATTFPLPGPTPDLLWGDTNTDGLVNKLDYATTLADLGHIHATWAQGDFNGDGIVDQNDLNLLLGNAPEFSPIPSATPEPAIGVGLLLLPILARRKQNRR